MFLCASSCLRFSSYLAYLQLRILDADLHCSYYLMAIQASPVLHHSPSLPAYPPAIISRRSPEREKLESFLSSTLWTSPGHPPPLSCVLLHPQVRSLHYSPLIIHPVSSESLLISLSSSAHSLDPFIKNFSIVSSSSSPCSSKINSLKLLPSLFEYALGSKSLHQPPGPHDSSSIK